MTLGEYFKEYDTSNIYHKYKLFLEGKITLTKNIFKNMIYLQALTIKQVLMLRYVKNLVNS